MFLVQLVSWFVLCRVLCLRLSRRLRSLAVVVRTSCPASFRFRAGLVVSVVVSVFVLVTSLVLLMVP